MLQRQSQQADTIARIPAEVRGFLLQVLMAPPAERAELIGHLHAQAETPGLVELFIDLEEEQLLALELADALKSGPMTAIVRVQPLCRRGRRYPWMWDAE